MWQGRAESDDDEIGGVRVTLLVSWRSVWERVSSLTAAQTMHKEARD